MNRYFDPCYYCHGSGRVEVGHDDEHPEGTHTVECGECNGFGMHMTDAGVELRTFLLKLEKAKARKS
jgi:DnaJ-class molecular chaperone